MAKSRVMSEQAKNTPVVPDRDATDAAGADAPETAPKAPPKEIGGREGPEPVRYGDWEKNGRCIDF
jgi:hypothetical protein